MNNFFLRSTIVALLLNFSSAGEVLGANRVVTPPATKCFIEVGNAHISTSILEQQGRLAVKVNATSRCNFPQRSVILTGTTESRLLERLFAGRTTQHHRPGQRKPLNLNAVPKLDFMHEGES